MRTVYRLLHERRAHPDNEALPLNDIPLRDVQAIIKLIDDANVMGFINSQVECAEQDLPFDELSAALRTGKVWEKRRSIRQRLSHLKAWRDAHRLNGDIPQGGAEEQPVGAEATPGDDDRIIEMEWAELSSFGRLYANLIEFIMDIWEWTPFGF
ncbi:unnamed protein product [Clonostachys solani]|uniref:Uncharacterized protein n=1 Tax=Clonostachys solani TaxID=160281 RepID=A0A9P0EJX9_9HYPO|nr:unnamed protein product [Clonostachys solani]